MNIIKMKFIKITVLALVTLSLFSCTLLAMPFRVTADVVNVVPLVGGPVASVLEGAGNVINPEYQTK